VDGEDLRGVSIILTVWPKAGVPTGNAIMFLDAEPLSWQRTVLGACRQLGLRPGTSYAFGIVQKLDLDADDPAVGPLWLHWKVQRRWVTVGLSRRYSGGYTELRLPHEQAARQPWERTLSGWLDTIRRQRLG
jgi:hypothetical protein